MTRYIYKITNTINGKVYIGQHKWNGDGLDPKYLCSSGNPHFWNSVQKYGISSFTKEIICYCASDEDLNEKEKYYIKLYNTTDNSKGYNLLAGGHGGWNYINDNGLANTPESISKALRTKRESGVVPMHDPEVIRKVQEGRRRSGYYESDSFKRTLELAHSSTSRQKAELTMKGRKNNSKILWIDINMDLHVMSYQNKSKYHPDWIFVCDLNQVDQYND